MVKMVFLNTIVQQHYINNLLGTDYLHKLLTLFADRDMVFSDLAAKPLLYPDANDIALS